MGKVIFLILGYFIKLLKSIFQEFLTRIEKKFILAGQLGTNL